MGRICMWVFSSLLGISLSLVCRQDTANSDSVIVYNRTSAEDQLGNHSCILSNNSAVNANGDLSSQFGIVCSSEVQSHTVKWYDPNDMIIHGNPYNASIFSGVPPSSLSQRSERELKRSRKLSQSDSNLQGIYTCKITDQNDIIQYRLYLGLYIENTVLSEVHLQAKVDTNGSEPTLILNCSSTGQPVTNVNWYFNDVLIGTRGIQEQLIPDKINTVYNSLLLITKDNVTKENGQYRCQLNTSITSTNTSSNFIIVPSTPARPVYNHMEGIISWSSVSSGNLTILGYDLLFVGGHCNTAQTFFKTVMTDNDSSSSSRVISVTQMQLELEGSANYTIKIRASNIFTVGNWSKPTDMHTPVNRPTGTPQNVSAVALPTKILLTWSEVNCSERNSATLNYHVSYSKESSATVPTTIEDVVGLMVTITGLEPSTNYTFSLAAMNENQELGPAYNITVTTSSEEDTGERLSVVIYGLIGAGVIVLLICILICLLVILCRQKRRKGEMSFINCDGCSVPLELEAVKVNYSLVINEPVIIDFPSDFEACEGEYVILYISVEGNPPPVITWYHNNNSINMDPSIEVSGDGTLSIPCMEEKHVGTYRLVVSNTCGSCYEELTLGLEEEDTFNLRRVESIASMIDNAPVPLSSFEEYVALHHQKNNEGFHFQFVCLNTYMEMETNIGSSPENKIYNRFKNIIPYDDSLICLKATPENKNEYINASYINEHTSNKFIATQGPLPHTMVDFWRLVWQEKTPAIVMLCSIVEGHRVKCQRYWPESGSHTYGPITVYKLSEQKLSDYVIQSFEVSLTAQSDDCFKVTHYQFTSWPDHSVPDNASALLSFHREIVTSDDVREGTILVHCSAGVGRTGVFIGLNTALYQAKEDKRIDIMGTVNSMRTQRMKMVQTLSQYIFIHDAVLEHLVCGETQIPVTNFRVAWNQLSRIHKDNGKTGLERQYQVLKKITPHSLEVERKSALKYPHLNRSMDYLPRDQRRVILNVAGSDSSDYIHASFIDGYKQKKAFIITQGPLQNTCNDFWQMIYQHKCGTIVMLSDLIEYSQEVCYQYWPKEGEVNYGSYSVMLLSENKVGEIVTRSMSLVHNQSELSQDVTQFQLLNWTPDGMCADYRSVADLIHHHTLKVQMRTGNNSVVVHCSDTVSRSAIFCAAVTAIEQFKTERVVDIFQIVKTMRMQKPSAILTPEQYSAIFSIVLAFSDDIDRYANFL